MNDMFEFGDDVELLKPVQTITGKYQYTDQAGRIIISCQITVPPKLIKPKMVEDDLNSALCCSFCGKSQNDVKKLVAGPSVYICDECITICDEIMKDGVKVEPEVVLPKPKRRKKIKVTL